MIQPGMTREFAMGGKNPTPREISEVPSPTPTGNQKEQIQGKNGLGITSRELALPFSLPAVNRRRPEDTRNTGTKKSGLPLSLETSR